MRSVLGKLIGRVSPSSTYVSPTAKRCISRAFPTFNPFPSLHVAPFTDFPRCKEGEAKGGSGSRRVKFNILNFDIVNVHDLLFTNNRDYLVKYNNQQVKAKQLAGKVIAILFEPLHQSYSGWGSSLLTEVYNSLKPNNVFEVVFVAVNDGDYESSIRADSHKLFLERISSMPWSAIPFSDIPSGEFLQRRFGFPEGVGKDESILIVDSMGMVLRSHDSIKILELYGALGYPFSYERIEYLKAEDTAAIMQPSLNTILASPQRDYVISNKGEKVPIHTLEDKVVAILFYEESETDDSDIEYLKMAYEELAKNKENFEVVLVYLTDTSHTYDCTNEESFWKAFKTMPWLAVPFQDLVNKKLKRIFEYLPHHVMEYLPPTMVIFGPRGEFIEPLAKYIFDLFGIPAYPFTRAKLAKLEAKKVKDLKLELLWDPNTVFRRENGSEVPFSQLLQKRVMIIFERSDPLEIEFLNILKGMYLQRKGTHDEFEVIHIVEGKIESGTELLPADMPWLISHASELLSSEFGCMYSLEFLSSILAFDNGRVVRRTFYPTLESTEFPFSTLDLEDEALAQLHTRYWWNYWEYYPHGGKIYSVRDKLLYCNYVFSNFEFS